MVRQSQTPVKAAEGMKQGPRRWVRGRITFLINYILKEIKIRNKALYTEQKYFQPELGSQQFPHRGKGMSVILHVQPFKTSVARN